MSIRKKQEIITVIGCGHMGQAISHSLLENGMKKIWVTNDDALPLVSFLQEHSRCCLKYSPKVTIDNQKAVKNSGYILLCVRPLQMKNVILEIKPVLKKNHVLISIAAGISMKILQKWSSHKKIVRVMPNLGAQIGLGMSVWKSAGLNAQEKKTVGKILACFGEQIEVNREDLINAATAISGSGPAYVFAFLEALEKSAADFGFSKHEAEKLALMTAYGSTVYASKQQDSFGALKEKVKTKGGTTEAAFKILDKKHWQKILQQGIKSAYKRAEEISKTQCS